MNKCWSSAQNIYSGQFLDLSAYKTYSSGIQVTLYTKVTKWYTSHIMYKSHQNGHIKLRMTGALVAMTKYYVADNRKLRCGQPEKLFNMYKLYKFSTFKILASLFLMVISMFHLRKLWSATFIPAFKFCWGSFRIMFTARIVWIKVHNLLMAKLAHQTSFFGIMVPFVDF